MRYFHLSFAIDYHDDMLARIGGLAGHNKTQIAYLDSALEQIQNDDYYPDFISKLTHIIFSCVKFHPFLDGNKRTAIYLGYHFANINNITCTNCYFIAMEDVVVKIADNSVSKDELKNILLELFRQDKC